MTTDEIELRAVVRSRETVLKRRRVFGSGVAVTLAAATMLTAPVVVAPHALGVGSASADSCPAVQVVFARGTGEAPGVGRVGAAFAQALRSQTSGMTVAVYAVDYPASREFLQATGGANDASSFVQGIAASCPETRVILGGYSQGAAVIDILTVASQPVLGFDTPLPADVANHVAAVAVFGNPSNRVRGPLTTLSPLYGEKTIDLCNEGDPVCSNGNDNGAHSQYVETGMTDRAARFAASRL